MKLLSEMGKYATVVVDPPWPVVQGAGMSDSWHGPQYDTMCLTDIAQLPITDVCANDSRIFLWVVNRFMPDAYRILDGWGATYNGTMTWVKTAGVKFPGNPSFNSEWCLVGKYGKPKWQETDGFRMANIWKRSGHSRKPEGFYDLLRRVTPGPRLDIFGRRRIAGFDSWGNEAPDGPALPDHYQQVLTLDIPQPYR